MAKWIGKKVLAWFGKTEDIAKLPEWYLDHATECMKRVQQMTSENSSTKMKLNLRQCKYLAETLKTAIETGRESYTHSPSSEPKLRYPEILKLLYRLATEIEAFINDCCKDEWMQTAIMSASVPVQVSSWGYQLKLCTGLLRNSNNLGVALLSWAELKRSMTEASRLHPVGERASLDEAMLLDTLKVVLSSKSSSEDQIQLANILHKRLEAVQVISTAVPPQSSNLELWKVHSGSLRRLKDLGKGTSAAVHKEKWFGAMEVAVKVYDVPRDAIFDNEMSILASLSHPSIVSFIGYWTDDRSCSIVTELMDGDLHDLMEELLRAKTRVFPFSISVACDTMLQVAEGVNYMHEKGIIHRDLKSQNVLIKRSKDDVEYVCVKVADFGLSKTKERSSYSCQTSNTGSFRSMAPELIELKGHDSSLATLAQGASIRVHPKKIDVYSYGMLCYEILTGNMPFSSIEKPKEVKMKVLNGDRPDLLPLECPEDLKRLVKLCWDHDPCKRPDFSQICEALRNLKCSLLIETRDSTKLATWYVDYASECMKRAQQMTSKSGSHTVKVNLSLCEYLVGKLEMAVEALYSRSSSSEHQLAEGAMYLRTLMLLCQLATEVEAFINDCCKDEWMVAALVSRSVPFRASSWGFYFELCIMILRTSNNLGAAWLSRTVLESLRRDALGAVEERASRDKALLLMRLKVFLSSKSSSEDQIRLARFVLDRMVHEQADSLVLSFGSHQWDLRNAETLGKGVSATVHRGIWVGVEVAIKKFYGGDNGDFGREVSILDGLCHPNVVNMFFIVKDKRSCSIVMELMDGDLSSEIQRMNDEHANEFPFNIDESVDLMLQIAEGVKHLHEHNIVHRDLKSANILVKRGKGTNQKMVQEFLSAKVADFGLSKTKERSTTYSNQTLNQGTTRWMAPESIPLPQDLHLPKGGMKYPFKVDVYSFSMICYEILTGNVPFSSLKPREVKQHVLSGGRPELPQECPVALKALILKCWSEVPIDRPSFAEICEELRFLKCTLLRRPGCGDLIQKNQATELDHAKALDLPKVIKPVQPIAKALDLSRLSLQKIESSCLNRGIQMGKGGSETIVYKAIYHRSKEIEEPVAQKYFIGACNEEFKKEVTILADLKHSNIVSLVGFAMDSRSCSIVMERMGGDLYYMMCRRMEHGTTRPSGPFSINEGIHVMLQIAQGMDYVHQKDFVHMDLKSYNILVKRANEGGKLIVKVADFGSSKHLKPGSKLRFNVGTLSWMAPEVMRLRKDEYMKSTQKYIPKFRKDPYFKKYPYFYFSNALGVIPFVSEKKTPSPFKSDIYSFGIVSFEILTGNLPTFHLRNQSEPIFFDKVFKKDPQKAAIFLLFLFLEGLKDNSQRAAVILLLLEGLDFKKDPQKAIVVLLLLHIKFKKDPIEVLKERVMAGHRPILPNYCPPKLKTLIESCWDPDASARPSFAQIIVDLKDVI